MATLGFFERSRFHNNEQHRRDFAERRHRRRMGARKQRRYLNSILLMGDRLAAGELSQSEVECEEEEFPGAHTFQSHHYEYFQCVVLMDLVPMRPFPPSRLQRLEGVFFISQS